MKITLKDFIFIQSLELLDKESKEQKLLEYFGMSYDKNSLDEMRKKISKLYTIDYTFRTKIFNYFYVKGYGFWKIENDIRKCPASQFVLFDSYLLQEKEIMDNLHNILSIYIRPVKWFKIEKWNTDKHSINANKLLNSDMNYIYPMINFFFRSAKKYIRNMNIIYLNEQQAMEA